MIDYRVYLLNPAGSIVKGWDLRRPSDEAALDHVRSALKPGQRAEVWQGTRRLGLVNTDDRIVDKAGATGTVPLTIRSSSQSVV